jgi:mRNA interferase RelE/StbE
VAFRIDFTKDAAEQLEALPKKIARQVLRRIEALAADPRPVQATRLTEHDHLYRIRSGDYRVLYQIHEGTLLVLVVKIAHRRDVYRRIPPPSPPPG